MIVIDPIHEVMYQYMVKAVVHRIKYDTPHTRLSNGEDVECISETKS